MVDVDQERILVDRIYFVSGYEDGTSRRTCGEKRGNGARIRDASTVSQSLAINQVGSGAYVEVDNINMSSKIAHEAAQKSDGARQDLLY